MAESPDPFIVVCGVGTGVAALVIITVGTFSLVRQRIPMRNAAAWETPREFAWFSLTIGLSLLLASMTIVAGGLGVRGLSWGTAFASLVLAVAAYYSIIRLVRRRN